jgi:methylmalonyl-CoA/ethylmalonyl-CoA epimerase
MQMADPSFKIQEIVVAAHDVEAAADRFARAVGGELGETVTWPEEGIEIEAKGVFLGDFHVGFVRDSSGQGPVSRFLDKRGEGLLEVCVQTDDLDAAIQQMKAAGMRFVSEEPTVLRDYPWGDETFSEVRIVFVHPSSANGVQFELQQWIK